MSRRESVEKRKVRENMTKLLSESNKRTYPFGDGNIQMETIERKCHHCSSDTQQTANSRQEMGIIQARLLLLEVLETS